jgi:uncharacterized membrane protein
LIEGFVSLWLVVRCNIEKDKLLLGLKRDLGRRLARQNLYIDAFGLLVLTILKESLCLLELAGRICTATFRRHAEQHTD